MARNLDAELEGRPLEAFTFHDKGFVVSVGTRRGVADIAGITTGGRLAHLLKDAIEWEYRQSVTAPARLGPGRQVRPSPPLQVNGGRIPIPRGRTESTCVGIPCHADRNRIPLPPLLPRGHLHGPAQLWPVSSGTSSMICRGSSLLRCSGAGTRRGGPPSRGGCGDAR